MFGLKQGVERHPLQLPQRITPAAHNVMTDAAVAAHPRRKALFVCSTGGHLDEMLRLRERFWPRFDEIRFVTSDGPQPRSLLRDEAVEYIPPVEPRDLAGALRTLPRASAILRDYEPDAVISTGAAVAVPFLLQARRLGIPAHYIESAARTLRPSLTGRMVARVPGVHLYNQYGDWASTRWDYRGSVFDGFEATDRAHPPDTPGLVVVTLGTQDQFPFRRAVEAIEPVVRTMSGPSTQVLWQVGATPVADLGIRGVRQIAAAELHSSLRAADLVFAHAGVGSCLRILEAGHVPVLLPRSYAHHEHVDNHQQFIAAELTRRQLAIHAEPEQLDVPLARLAMARDIRRRVVAPRFSLA